MRSTVESASSFSIARAIAPRATMLLPRPVSSAMRNRRDGPVRPLDRSARSSDRRRRAGSPLALAARPERLRQPSRSFLRDCCAAQTDAHRRSKPSGTTAAPSGCRLMYSITRWTSSRPVWSVPTARIRASKRPAPLAPRAGEWTHSAFVPGPLAEHPPALSSETWMRVANARAALAALDSTA